MKKRKKRKLTKQAKLLFTKLIIFTIIIIFIVLKFKSKSYTKETNSKKYDDFIVDINEDYSNKKQVSKGMNLTSLTNILDKLSTTPSYIKSSGSYTKVNYNFEKFLSYTEIENIINKLNNSEIAKTYTISKSFDNRNIYVLEIGKGENISMFEGNIHAAEIAPLLFLTKYSVDLVNAYENGNEEVTNMLNNNKIVIIPSINPDGYEYSVSGKESIKNKNSYVYENSNLIEKEYFKANINGVDINRNLPSRNGGLYFKNLEPSFTLVTKKSTNKLEYFPGNELGSEPETQALLYFMYKYYKNAHVYAAIHSAGQVIYHGKPDLSNEYNKICTSMADIVNNITGYVSLGTDYEDVGYGSDGSATDMIAELKHGFKFNKKTGRLTDVNNVGKFEGNFCAMTIETLENYTQDINIIKNEYYDKNLYKAFTSLIAYR